MLSQDERTRPSGSQAIERAAQLLVLILEQDQPTTLGELARMTDLPKSTTSRLVAALERNSLVQRDSARGAIRPGPAVLRFAQRGVEDIDLAELAAPVLHALAAESGETINLAVPATTGPERVRYCRVTASAAPPPKAMPNPASFLGNWMSTNSTRMMQVKMRTAVNSPMIKPIIVC